MTWQPTEEDFERLRRAFEEPKITPQMRVRESMWWCLKRQVGVVGGWGNALLCWPLVWDSARDLQREIKELHRR